MSRVACIVLVLLTADCAQAQWLRGHFHLDRTNREIAGQVVDYTHNHGADRRIWSEALQARRDLYVYLPPNYDPQRQYPLLIWLHGFGQDEMAFLLDVVRPLDEAIATGKLPPMIMAAPDGSLRGAVRPVTAGTFFLNTPAGAYEDFLMIDVWDFVTTHYPVRPEREAHIIAGVSMGGGAAFHEAIKYPERFGVVLGIFPPLNVRWQDCHGHWNAPFDPDCWGWRTDLDRCLAPVAHFGLYTIRARNVTFPLYGRGCPEIVPATSRENPIEMLDRYPVRETQGAWFVAYAGRDQFNIGAQVNSFLFVARQRGIKVDCVYDPDGHHDRATAYKMLPEITAWLGARLAAYAEPCGAEPR